MIIVIFYRWINTNESERSGMAVLDVTIPTGYIIQQQKLDAYILKREIKTLQRATFHERHVIFYFDYVSDFIFVFLNLGI